MTYFYGEVLGSMVLLCSIDVEINHNEIDNISDAVFCEFKYKS